MLLSYTIALSIEEKKKLDLTLNVCLHKESENNSDTILHMKKILQKHFNCFMHIKS